MADPLGRINVMAYHEGDQLNWHFDRAEFTTTVLLQAPCSGGEFRYRSALRSESDPNYNGVARLLAGQDERVQTLALEPGTLNVFMGKNTAHRVTPVEGDRPRIVAVFSYYETPGFAFSDAERVGFYGRTASAREAAPPDACRTRSNPIRPRITPQERRTMPIGTVKWFNATKGYGFIAPEDGSKDAFVHISAVERAGLGTLHEGQRVSYELRPGRDGKFAAEELAAADQ